MIRPSISVLKSTKIEVNKKCRSPLVVMTIKHIGVKDFILKQWVGLSNSFTKRSREVAINREIRVISNILIRVRC